VNLFAGFADLAMLFAARGPREPGDMLRDSTSH
jgi:hypothetical protein